VSEAVSRSATSALNAVVWVFAGMTVLVVLVFLITLLLSLRHRNQRRRARDDIDDARRWVSDPAGRLDNLTVGDLVGDPQLRQAVLRKRSELGRIVAAWDATDTPPSSSEPDAPTPH
jgi:hypothetical protein